MDMGRYISDLVSKNRLLGQDKVFFHFNKSWGFSKASQSLYIFKNELNLNVKNVIEISHPPPPTLRSRYEEREKDFLELVPGLFPIGETVTLSMSI